MHGTHTGHRPVALNRPIQRLRTGATCARIVDDYRLRPVRRSPGPGQRHRQVYALSCGGAGPTGRSAERPGQVLGARADSSRIGRTAFRAAPPCLSPPSVPRAATAAPDDRRRLARTDSGAAQPGGDRRTGRTSGSARPLGASPPGARCPALVPASSARDGTGRHRRRCGARLPSAASASVGRPADRGQAPVRRRRGTPGPFLPTCGGGGFLATPSIRRRRLDARDGGVDGARLRITEAGRPPLPGRDGTGRTQRRDRPRRSDPGKPESSGQSSGRGGRRDLPRGRRAERPRRRSHRRPDPGPVVRAPRAGWRWPARPTSATLRFSGPSGR